MEEDLGRRCRCGSRRCMCAEAALLSAAHERRSERGESWESARVSDRVCERLGSRCANDDFHPCHNRPLWHV